MLVEAINSGLYKNRNLSGFWKPQFSLNIHSKSLTIQLKHIMLSNC